MCKPYFKKHLPLLIAYIAICIFTSLFSLVTPAITGSFIDMLTHASNSQALWSYCIIFIIINILQTVFGYINGRMYVQLQMSMGFDFNKDLVQHVQHVSLQFVEKQDASYLSQRINNDANNLVIFCIGDYSKHYYQFVNFCISIFNLVSL